MGSSRKRRRAIGNNNLAECPFTVTAIAALPCEEPGQASKKRKRGQPGTSKINFVQPSPFKPNGKFNTCQTLDTSYSVKPYKRWSAMTRYRSFVLNNVKYYCDDFVYVDNDKSVERQEATSEGPQYQGVLELAECWVAKILEIRASDEYHVYARVYWMYSPDELPPNTLDNEKMVSGRQLYHGQNELIASNHMDVINVVSVVMRAVVHHCEGSEDGPILDALHWRQDLDCCTLQLSVVGVQTQQQTQVRSVCGAVHNT